jgi:hypothetical protein
MSQEAKSKDLMIKFKGVDMKKNSKGGDYLILKLNPEETEAFVAELQGKVTDRGIRLDIHVSDKESEGGRAFKSGICFVKGIQEFGAATNTSVASPRKPAANVVSSTEEAIKKLKQQVR